MATQIHGFGPNGELSPGAAAALAGLGGGGSTTVQIGTLTLPASPAQGQSVSVLADSTTVLPEDVTWDSGGEPTVTDRLLISFVWSGTDWVGTYGLPIPAVVIPDPEDETPPTPGTLAASSITDTSFTLTVTGASDETALHSQPYAFSTDNGSTWTAWQTSPSRNMTGLTAETEYTCAHKVRDAALNEATGTSIPVETEAEPIGGDTWVETFSDGTGTAPPAGWTQRWGSVVSWNEEAGYLLVDVAAPNPWFASFDTPGIIAGDVDVVAKLQSTALPASSGTGYGAGIAVAGGGSDETKDLVTAYLASFSGSGSLRRTTYANGVATPAATNHTSPAWTDVNGEVYVRVNVTGSTISFRAWDAAASEPATWDGTATLASPSGYVGLYHGGGADTSVLYFAVSTEGPAPLEA